MATSDGDNALTERCTAFDLKTQQTDILYWCYFDTSKKLVRWNVATGVITPPHILDPDQQLPSLFHLSRIKREPAYLELEIRLERVRRAKFPDKVSRLQCLYAFEDAVSARRARNELDVRHFDAACLSEVCLLKGGKTSRHDSNWITYWSESASPAADDWFDDYWSGAACPRAEPVWEVLVDGRLMIYNHEMRTECYNRLESELSCHFMLRLAVMAPAVGFDLGQSAIYVASNGICRIMTQVLKFDESTAIKAYLAIKTDYPEQAAQIRPFDIETLCIMPDGSDESFCLVHKCHPSECPIIEPEDNTL